MGCHSAGNQRLVRRTSWSKGQSTVEFALITVGFIALAVALGVMWRFLSDGTLVQHALAAASHHLQAAAPAFISDIFLY